MSNRRTIVENLISDVYLRLKTGLPQDLYYHCPEHTLDVLEASRRIAASEGIDDSSLLLLEVAAVYHDSGFLVTYANHEEASCEIAKKDLPSHGFDQDEIDEICDMIMATRIPQSPKDKLGEIICDADLDYLGTNQFWTIGKTLYREFLSRGIVTDEESWNRLQVGFLTTHHYFTESCIRDRNDLKANHLKKIKDIVASY